MIDSAFISPARIVVLTLLDMYCSDEVLDGDDDFVLQLIGSHVADGYAHPATQRQRHLARWQRAYLSVDLLARLASLRPALQRCFVAAPATPADVPLCATLWDALVARLWLHLTTLDDLGPFFDGLRTRLAPTYAELRARREQGVADPPAAQLLLGRRSPLGRLVHQACVEYDRLAFVGRCDLWEDFVRYRQPTRTDFKILWPHHYPIDRMLFDANLTEGLAAWGGARTEAVARVAFDRMDKNRSVTATSDETDRLMGVLIDRERYGFRPPADLRAAADRVIAGTATVPTQATLYRLADAVRTGNINTAYDHLHRFFDLVSRSAPGATFGYHAGPLNKAVIQRDFGEHAYDLLSMLDAVHAGREARDYQSLRFSLLWLFMYARTLPRHIRPHQLQGLAGQSTDGRQVLPYVRQDASVTEASGHHAMASLLEARVALGDGRAPLVAKTRLRDSSRVVVASADAALEGKLASAEMLFWERMGHGRLAAVHGRAFLATRGAAVPFDDAVRVAARLALQHGQAGDFARAKAVLLGLDPAGMASLRPQSTRRHVLTVLAATQALRAHRFAEADDLLERRLPRGGFASCAPPAADRPGQGPAELDPDLAAQVALLRVAALAARADARAGGAGAADDAALAAARAALDAFERAYDRGVGDLHVVLQAHLARCGLYARAGRGLRVLTFLLRTVQACLRRRYHGLLWAAAGALAQLLLAHGEFRAARLLLDALVPRVLEAGDAAATAALYDHLADAYMGLAGAMRSAPPAGRPGYDHDDDKNHDDPDIYSATAVREHVPQTAHRRLAKMKLFLARAWRALGRAQDHYTRAGAGEPVRQTLAAKRRLILAASRQAEAWEAAQPAEKGQVQPASCVVN